MKRTFLIGSAIAAASLTALWAFAGATASHPQGNPLPGLASRGEDYSAKYTEVGDARVLVVVSVGVPANPFPHTDAQGMMATRMRVSILEEGGGLYSLFQGGDASFPVLFAMIENRSSTKEYTFDPPLRIGDGFSSSFSSIGLLSAVEFYGTALPPARIGGETIVVE